MALHASRRRLVDRWTRGARGAAVRGHRLRRCSPPSRSSPPTPEPILPPERRQHRGLVLPAVFLGLFAVWTMLAAGTHVHSHTEDAEGHTHGTEEVADGAAALATDDGHTHAADEAADDVAAEASDGHSHTADEATDGHVHIIDPAGAPAAEPVALAWPRPWDPTQPVDLSGVPGVTTEQQLRATKLVDDTLASLPRFADPADAIAAGYSSIGDAGTGSEHFIKGRSHRRRRPPRSARSRITRLQRRERPAHARRRDVHRQRPPRRRSVAHRLGRPAHDVAQARQPLLVARRERQRQGGRDHRRQRQLRQRRPHGRCEPDGARVDPTAPVRRVRGARRHRCRHRGRARGSTRRRLQRGTRPWHDRGRARGRRQTVRPDAADRSQWHARRHPATAGRRREPHRRHARRTAAVERLPRRRGRRLQEHRRRGRPATSTSCSGTGSKTM